MNENICFFYISVFYHSLRRLAALPNHSITLICFVLQEFRKAQNAPSVKMIGR